jgi:DNA-binding GntR family transcriptional regulator
VWEISLTHTLDDAPVSASQMYLRIQGTLTVSGPPEFQSGGPDILQQLATKYGVDIVDSDLEIEMTRASRFESRSLGIEEGSPVVQVSSLDFAAGDRVVGFTRTVVRPERFFFAVAVHRKSGVSEGRALSGLVGRAID